MSSWDTGPGPDLNVLYQWWGTTTYASTIGLADISAALNLGPWCGNPLYQLDDFLGFYPQFGTAQQGVQTATVDSGGSSWAVNDTANLIQPDASGCVLTVTAESGGVVSGVSISQQGQGYRVDTGLATTAISPSTGTGLTVNVTLITPSNINFVPSMVIQAYINYATSCLSAQRWGAAWPIAMGLFVAHYVTLYLKAVGTSSNPTASSLAAAGLAGGIIVAQSAGDVSQSYEAPPGLEEFAAWNLTVYGQQLATMAKTVGMGMIYAW